MKNFRSARRARLGIAVLTVALTVGACGSSRGGSDDGTSTSEGDESSASTKKFGDIESPCGKGDAKGATDQGVTDSSIAIGFGDDRGFVAAPGMSEEMGDAVKAVIGWCNDQGGINGRKLVGHQYDAAMTDAASVMQKACTQDFMLVGEGFAYDEAAEQFRVGCDLPAVAGFTIGSNATMGPNKFESVPRPVDYFNGALVDAAMTVRPEAKAGITVIGSTSAPIDIAGEKVMDVYGQLGAKVEKCGVKISQDGEASYMPLAQKLKGCPAKALWMSNSPGAITFGMLEALQRSDADVKHIFEATWYSDATSQWNGKTKAIDGMITSLVFQPLENADVVPAVQDYVDLTKTADIKPSLLGMQGVSAFFLWAETAKACGSDLTRDCMMDGLSKVHDWTGGGLHAPTDPGANKPATCALVVELTGDKYKQVFPEKRGEFSCDESKLTPVDPAKSGVTLDANRISTTFAKK